MLHEQKPKLDGWLNFKRGKVHGEKNNRFLLCFYFPLQYNRIQCQDHCPMIQYLASELPSLEAMSLKFEPCLSSILVPDIHPNPTKGFFLIL